MVLGDENNDLTMFEVAGFGVAMGNANDQIKDLASAVTAVWLIFLAHNNKVAFLYRTHQVRYTD